MRSWRWAVWKASGRAHAHSTNSSSTMIRLGCPSDAAGAALTIHADCPVSQLVGRSVSIYWALLWACPTLSTEKSVMVKLHPHSSSPTHNLTDSTFEMSFTVVPSRWEEEAGVQAQVLSPVPRGTPAPSSHLDSLCPLQQKLLSC